jgi:hypothetical protein
MIDSPDMRLDPPAAGRGRSTDTAGRLPRPPTSFVGREHELAEARQLLDHNRLMTLTGPGGCGKTRLSIELTESARTPTWLASTCKPYAQRRSVMTQCCWRQLPASHGLRWRWPLEPTFSVMASL